MSLSGIGSYQSFYQMGYQKSTYTKSSKKVEKKEDIQKTDKLEIYSKKEVKLSGKAQKYLESLKKKYNNMDFIIADYSSEEEAKSLMSQGQKDYSVLIDPETLEEMAADKEVGAKYEGIISNATGELSTAKEQLEKSGETVTNIGMTVDKDGIVKFFAEVDRQRKSQEENQDKNDTNKKDNLKATANSIEELLEKIKEARKEEEANKQQKQYVPFEAIM